VDAKSWLVLILFLAACLGAGGMGSFFTGNSVREWYPGLRKPPGTPPSWVFGPVWTALYVLIAVAAWLVWNQYGAGARPALLLFFGQLSLNVAWSAIFFGSRKPGLAFAEIVVLWLAVASTAVIFTSLLPVAGILLVPYWLWVTFAAYLNLGIWRLNRG
jgi:tryptophan-rich sensory protein